MKVWERRLMKGFQVAPMQASSEQELLSNVNGEGEMREVKVETVPSKPAKETARQRFQRAARTVLLQSSTHKWNVVLQGTLQNSQIGRSTKYQRKSLCNLGKAIEEAKK